jgi:DNA-binding response OmpR family regulator
MAKPKTILVVDDDPDIRRVYTDLLTDAGYHVMLASAGWEALAAVQAERPNLAIVDLCLPGMDGFDVCRDIAQGCFRAEVPVIVVSALTDIKSQDYAMRMGARAYVEKPFSPTFLLDVIENVLSATRIFEP